MLTFHMPRCGLEVTWKCNLKCKLCSSFIPYSNNIREFSLESSIRAIKRYFEIVTFVDKFTLTGGEPLLFPDLPLLINFISEFRDSIGNLEIITNGSILPDQHLIESCNKFGKSLFFLIDNYGNDLSNKVEGIDSLLTLNQVRHTIRNQMIGECYCNGWVDFGDLTKRKRTSDKEIELLYSKCAQPQKYNFCFMITDGFMYPCAPCRYCKEQGIEDNYNEYIYLFDETLTIEQQRQKILNIYNGKSLSACGYCNGICDDSPRFIPAEQLTKEELKYIKLGAKSYSEIQEMQKQN